MVRTKAQAKRPMTYLADPCSSGSSFDQGYNPGSLFGGEMGKSTPLEMPLTQLVVRDPPTGGTLSTPDGYWIRHKIFLCEEISHCRSEILL